MAGRTKEINALLHLMDDPDTEVFKVVSGRLLGYGKEIIPRLEQLWENTSDEVVQERIENLIHRAQFQSLQLEILNWAKTKKPTLLDGALLVARYRYPDLDKDLIIAEIEQLQKNIWLELNHYMSPLEQVNVINGILFNYYRIQGEDDVNKDPDHYCLNYLLENHIGNNFSIGVLYLMICESLDIPIFGVALPRQFILGYFDNLYHFSSPDKNPVQIIQFYVDAVTGMIYTQNDVDIYLKKIKIGTDFEDYKTPLNNKQVVFKMFEELAITYAIKDERANSLEVRQFLKILEPFIKS